MLLDPVGTEHGLLDRELRSTAAEHPTAATWPCSFGSFSSVLEPSWEFRSQYFDRSGAYGFGLLSFQKQLCQANLRRLQRAIPRGAFQHPESRELWSANSRRLEHGHIHC